MPWSSPRYAPHRTTPGFMCFVRLELEPGGRKPDVPGSAIREETDGIHGCDRSSPVPLPRRIRVADDIGVNVHENQASGLGRGRGPLSSRPKRASTPAFVLVGIESTSIKGMATQLIARFTRLISSPHAMRSSSVRSAAPCSRVQRR